MAELLLFSAKLDGGSGAFGSAASEKSQFLIFQPLLKSE
jgi:hypothetical protein